MKRNGIREQLGAVVCGVTSLGERGQLVVPKETRDRLRLKSGDRFLVVEHFGKIILVPEDMTRGMIKEITKHLDK